jgi:hypothetical protein
MVLIMREYLFRTGMGLLVMAVLFDNASIPFKFVQLSGICFTTYVFENFDKISEMMSEN